MKKNIIINFILSIVLLFIAVPNSFAAYTFTASNVTFNNGTLSFSTDQDFSGYLNFEGVQDITDSTRNATVNNNHYPCSSTFCSFLLANSGSSIQNGDTVNIVLTKDYNDYHSQNFIWPPAAPTTTPTPTVTPTPTISGTASIDVSPSSGTKTVGTPFNITVAVNSTAGAFNAARASISVSSNLTVSGLHNATSNACNFQYTKTPTTSDPSFAGAIFGSSSSSCNVYTVTLTPNASGTGTITLSNGSIKSYADSSEILTGVQNASFTINAAGDTPTPTSPLSQLTVTSPLETYKTSYNLGGTKDTAITSVFVNSSSTGVIYPTDTTWQITKTLSLGNNAFTIYGADANSNQTATQNVTISRHTLGDINGDGTVDLTDASMFAIDFDKTSDLTYILSDMNDDGNADLTDLSIIAKLEAE